MNTLLILFEDHTSQQFRPLTWSRPAYEIPCGMFNLRERATLAASDCCDLALLPISNLEPLQKQSGLDGIHIGFESCLNQLSNYQKIIFMTARYAGNVSKIAEVINSESAVQSDDKGLVLAVVDTAQAAEILNSWKTWDGTACEDESRVSATKPSAVWNPSCESAPSAQPVWNYLWDMVHDIGSKITSDLDSMRDTIERNYFGLQTSDGNNWSWNFKTKLTVIETEQYSAVNTVNPENIFSANSVAISPGVVLDASAGPIIIDNDVTIMANAFLEGPLYIGPGSTIKAGSTIYGETAIGAECKVGGEVAESQFCAYSNKQHDGFIGHAVIGSWCNLGAGTNCSDLSNNYSLLKANYGHGPVATQSCFVGLMIGDHAKSAIGTQFNTATTVGFSSNIFSAGFPRTCLSNYCWGDGRLRKSYNVDKAIAVAEIVMARRNCKMLDEHKKLFTELDCS
ncbi:hypothetical protein HN388_06480 [bacterium]|nr:hypothetical protein [bacterium]MBT4292327.1 hypothetical protein [bacterium]